MQDFVRDPLFTQKTFFSDSGVAMLKDAVAVADSVNLGQEFNLCSVLGDGCNQQLVSNLQSRQGKVAVRWKASRDTCDRWFGVPSDDWPSAGTSTDCGGVRILNVGEEGQVEYVAVLQPTASEPRSGKSPVIGS